MAVATANRLPATCHDSAIVRFQAAPNPHEKMTKTQSAIVRARIVHDSELVFETPAFAPCDAEFGISLNGVDFHFPRDTPAETPSFFWARDKQWLQPSQAQRQESNAGQLHASKEALLQSVPRSQRTRPEHVPRGQFTFYAGKFFLPIQPALGPSSGNSLVVARGGIDLVTWLARAVLIELGLDDDGFPLAKDAPRGRNIGLSNQRRLEFLRGQTHVRVRTHICSPSLCNGLTSQWFAGGCPAAAFLGQVPTDAKLPDAVKSARLKPHTTVR